MQPTTSNNDSRPIFSYDVHNQAGFDNPFINGRGFIYLGISKMSFTYSVFTRVQGSVSKKAARKANYLTTFEHTWGNPRHTVIGGS